MESIGRNALDGLPPEDAASGRSALPASCESKAMGHRRSGTLAWRNPHIHELLALSDFVVMVNRTAYAKMDYPLVALESMCLARPVLVGKGTPSAELAEGGGAVAVETSGEALAEAIESLSADEASMPRNRTEGRVHWRRRSFRRKKSQQHTSCSMRKSMREGSEQKARQYYDDFSDSYERGRGYGYHQMIDDLEVQVTAPYARGARVLELGCGTGLILARVAEIAEEAVGIDLSEGMAQRARDRGLDVHIGSVCDLPFEDDEFDLTYSFKVLAHIPDIDAAVREAARVTRPGGHLLLEFYNPWRPSLSREKGRRPSADQ